MNEKVIADALILITTLDMNAEDTALLEVISAQRFRDAGVLTNDEGLVLRMRDGSEYQITITRSL